MFSAGAATLNAKFPFRSNISMPTANENQQSVATPKAYTTDDYQYNGNGENYESVCHSTFPSAIQDCMFE